MFFIVAEWNAVLKDTPGMNNDDDTRTDESTRGSIYTTFWGLCELAEKQRNCPPSYSENTPLTNKPVRDRTKDCPCRAWSLMKNSHSTLNLRPHFFSPLSINPNHSIRDRTTTQAAYASTKQHTHHETHHNNPQKFSQSVQSTQYPIHQLSRPPSTDSSSDPAAATGYLSSIERKPQFHHQKIEKRHPLYTLGTQANYSISPAIQFSPATRNLSIYKVPYLGRYQEKQEGGFFLWSKKTNKNDDNKRIIAPPRKCMKRIGRGIGGDG